MQLLPRTVRRALCLVALLLIVGCTTTRRFTAPTRDYTSYRKTRVAKTLEERLRAASEYLTGFPNGAFRSEVRAWFEATERAYYDNARDSVAELERYLAALPDGPHAADASQRVAELELAAEYRRRAERKSLEDARHVQASLAEAAELRERLIRVFSDWILRLLSIDSWGGRTHELPHEFIHAYRLTEPAARCTTSRCIKMLSVRYAIPEAGTLGSREAVFDVALELDKGGVERALVAGPELFSRLGEAIALRPITPDAGLARTEALSLVSQLVEGLVESRLPAMDCEREAISPVIIHRQCKGLTLRMVAAAVPNQEDRIEVAPSNYRKPN